jgi:hypothetical protein
MSEGRVDGEEGRTLLLGGLVDRRVIDADGRDLGHVVDVELTRERPWRVRSLVLGGSSGWIHRLRLDDVLWTHLAEARSPQVVAWDEVEAWDEQVIRLRRSRAGKQDVERQDTPPAEASGQE